MNANPVAYSSIAEDVRAGLCAEPKSLPPKLFYDAHGSELFESITALPEYYLTRTERRILQEHGASIIERAGRDLTVVELGAGSAAKTVLLLEQVSARQKEVRYVPVDVSAAALHDASSRLRTVLPNVDVHPVVADYMKGLLFLQRVRGRKLILYIGSSIGNFEPLHACALLSRLRAAMSPGDAVLLGTDMRKDPKVLLRAYDDSQGVTAEFNKNMLVRINRELGADFSTDAFTHKAVWNDTDSRIEMHLESVTDQMVRVRELGLTVRFKRGERIHTENSYKFSMDSVRAIVNNSGLVLEESWSDQNDWFTVHLLRKE